ncbi:hypothetical protein O1M54_18480 [Streptomyces diastatochromogenes]|nr:hypothetical protein [Streptomyces diastatochromogenes]
MLPPAAGEGADQSPGAAQREHQAHLELGAVVVLDAGHHGQVEALEQDVGDGDRGHHRAQEGLPPHPHQTLADLGPDPGRRRGPLLLEPPRTPNRQSTEASCATAAAA